MILYVARRIIATIPVLLLVAIIVFSLLYLAPGDPAAVLAGDQATAEEIARLRASLGLDQSFLTRFFQWGGGILRGDLGVSVFSGKPVTTLIAQRLEPTIALTIMSLFFAVVIALPLGVVAAWKADSWLDKGAMGFAVLGFSVPVFVLAYCLIFIFSVPWLPLSVHNFLRRFQRPPVTCLRFWLLLPVLLFARSAHLFSVG